MVFCCQAMKGEIINCSTNKDIYFLETNTKNESTDLANLFASPSGREMFKFKPRLKHKQKLNPALDFLIQNQSGKHQTTEQQTTTKNSPSSSSSSNQDDNSIAGTSSSTSSTVEESAGSRSRKNSIDLYEEAAAILGLTCQQTDDCKCLECQCHYFDFEEDIDFPSGSDYVMDHSSSCCIQ